MWKTKCLILIMLLAVISEELLAKKQDKNDNQKRSNTKSNNNKNLKKNQNSFKRIINGHAAESGKYPFIVSIWYMGSHMCGGTIITPGFILTAAHCCFNGLGDQMSAYDMKISVGNLRWREGVKYSVARVLAHESYNSDTIKNDIALLRLRGEIEFRPGVDTIRLHTAPIDDNKNLTATVIGWGFSAKKGQVVEVATEELMYVDIYTVPFRNCKPFYQYLYPGNLCMTSADSRGSCNGDSGGPLVIEVKGTLAQIGLVSYGGDCNNTQPEVYTRVSTFYPWIKNTLKKYSDIYAGYLD